eukprot:scaffold72916_cov67-Phaeocystis_antarctica.AAC.8
MMTRYEQVSLIGFVKTISFVCVGRPAAAAPLRLFACALRLGAARTLLARVARWRKRIHTFQSWGRTSGADPSDPRSFKNAPARGRHEGALARWGVSLKPEQ